MIARFFRRLNRTWLLALCDLALVLALAYELAAPASVSSRPAPEQHAAAATAEATPPSFAMPPIRQYHEVLARPLFNRSRRPDLAAEDGAKPVASLQLVGIVITSSSRAVLLQYGNPPKLVRAGVGQAVAGWTISEIGPEAVLVRQGDTVAHVKPPDVPPSSAETVSAVAAAPSTAAPAAAAPATAPPSAAVPRGEPPADVSPPAASQAEASPADASPATALPPVAPWPAEGTPSAWGSLRRYLEQTHSDDR